MSTVVSAIKDGIIHMCGDTAGSYANGTLTHSNKVYDGGGYLVGCCGTRDPYLAMYYDFSLPPNVGLSRKDYIAGPLRTALRDVLGYMEDDTFSLHLGFYYQGQPCLIEINGDMGGMEELHGSEWVCAGSGKEIAMGVMAALWDTGMDVQDLLEKTIEIASRHNAFTMLPHVYHSLSPE